MSADNIKNAADMVKAINHSIGAFKKFITDNGYEAKLTEILLNASDTDEIFMAQNLTKVLSVIENMTVILRYLDKPVRKKGRLHIAGNTVLLDGEALAPGANFEVLINNEWKVAALTSGEVTLINENGEALPLSRLDGTEARVR